MLDKKKIRLMTKAAIYDKETAEEDIKISSYYQKDYISLNTWITLIWITAGFALASGLFALCNGEGLMNEITIFKLLILFALAAGLYLVLVIIYGIGASVFYKNRHMRAKQRVKKYLRELSRIEKINEKKEKTRS